MLRQRWGYGPVSTLKPEELQGADASAARLTPIPEHSDGRRTSAREPGTARMARGRHGSLRPFAFRGSPAASIPLAVSCGKAPQHIFVREFNIAVATHLPPCARGVRIRPCMENQRLVLSMLSDGCGVGSTSSWSSRSTGWAAASCMLSHRSHNSAASPPRLVYQPWVGRRVALGDGLLAPGRLPARQPNRELRECTRITFDHAGKVKRAITR
jgi:hypothetical protein